jgi:phosphoglycolate phosphatase-like HAD superfamily hydrolase
MIEPGRSRLGIDELMKVRVCADDTPAGKPDPRMSSTSGRR